MASPWGHLADALTFRTLGGWIIVHEVLDHGGAQWPVLVAGFACFFMPDAMRGKDSPLLRLVAAWRGQPQPEEEP